MKRSTITWRIFQYNLIVIIMLITLTTIIFNVAIRLYIEKDITEQLKKIAAHTEETVLQQGPGFFPPEGLPHLPYLNNSQNPYPGNNQDPFPEDNLDFFKFYFMLDRSLRDPLSVLNADYILLDDNNQTTPRFPAEFSNPPAALLNLITGEIRKLPPSDDETYLNFNLSGTEYRAIIKHVSQKNSFGLGWIVIYSSLQKVNQLQMRINIILFLILLFSALIIGIFSSLVSKKISAPFSSLNQHIRAIAERKFGTKIQMPVDDELQEFVNNINVMSEKLETYDEAQKTFLQNVSHEFRTPLMSIQSYAEGIKYDVVDQTSGVDVIIQESKRLTQLVEDLLYMSRLDAIEENYTLSDVSYDELINSCLDRMHVIAVKNGVKIVTASDFKERIALCIDEEKLSRAITNILGNCIRHAKSMIEISAKTIDHHKIELTISDDGPGFEINDLSKIFERYYKGKNGNFGLGLAIAKNVVEKHNGTITAENSQSGAIFKVVLPVKKLANDF